MALVKTPRAVVLQQTDGHRADSIPGHFVVGRHGVRRPVFPAVVRRHFERDGAAVSSPGKSARAAGFWLLLIVTATPLLGIGTILMTIDPPLVLVLDMGDDRRLARGATGRTNPRLARGRPGYGTRFSLQIHRRLPDCLLGDFLCALAGGARASAAARSVAGAADFPGLHHAGHHLECATRLDHRPSRRGQRRTGQTVASDAALFLGLFVRGSGLAESDFLHRRTVGHAGFWKRRPRTSAVALFFLHGRAAVSRLLALLVSLANFAELDCARRSADVLPDGRVLG